MNQEEQNHSPEYIKKCFDNFRDNLIMMKNNTFLYMPTHHCVIIKTPEGKITFYFDDNTNPVAVIFIVKMKAVMPIDVKKVEDKEAILKTVFDLAESGTKVHHVLPMNATIPENTTVC